MQLSQTIKIGDNLKEVSTDKFTFIRKIREKQAESCKYTDKSMEKSYQKLVCLDLAKLEELSKLNIVALKNAGY